MNYNRSAVSPYLLALVVIFSLFFVQTIFLANDDYLIVGLAANSSGIDPLIIVHGIQNLFAHPVYNQFNSYGTTFYGWVFNDIAFFIILILKALGHLFGFYQQPIFTATFDQPIFIGAIRAVTFTMALLSVLLFYNVTTLIFNNRKLAFATAMFFMFIPFGSRFAYFIHPDATGMVFMLIAIRYLILFTTLKPKGVYFYLSFISLVLATLSKQSFLFIAAPILLLFLSAHCRHTQTSYVTFIWSKAFIKLVVSLVVLSIVALFIVHPYSIIDYPKLLSSQTFQTACLSVGTGITFAESFQKWALVYKSEPLIYLNLAFLPLLVMYCLFLRAKFAISYLWAISVIFCNVLLLLIIPSGARLFFSKHYVYPISPLLLLNIVAVALPVWYSLLNRRYMRYAFVIVIALLVVPLFTRNILSTTNAVLMHSAYKHLTAYRAREFSLAHIPFEQPVLHDPGLSLTINHARSSNTWNCPSYDAIRTFSPSFILLEEGYPYVDHKPVYQYIADHQYELTNKIQANTTIQFPDDSFWQTKELVEVLCDPNRIIGPTILLYHIRKARKVAWGDKGDMVHPLVNKTLLVDYGLCCKPCQQQSPFP